ncbi:MAG: hypothetical protein HOV79_33145 [Hamadaea sp.]|nr:hypothetical protein [Hamadaea sp.]
MRLRLIAATTLAALATLAFANPAAADHSWGGYHWARTANPLQLKIADNVGSAWDSYLNTAISDWNQSTVLSLTKVAGSVNPKTCKPVTGRVDVCNATYGNNGWLGIAGISITGGEHITKSYVKLNDTYFNTAQYNTTAWRNLVMCQEIGHAFGLDHQDENFDNANLGTCMDYTSNPGTNQHPNAHDYDQLEEIYAHLDSFNSATMSVPTAGPSAVGDSPASWGKLVAGSHTRGFGVYVRDFGNGNLFVTHVFWAN